MTIKTLISPLDHMRPQPVHLRAHSSHVQIRVDPYGHVDGVWRLSVHAVGGDERPLPVDHGALAENVELDVGGVWRVADGDLPGMPQGSIEAEAL